VKSRLYHPKILYIGDKWCAANIKFGLSEWEKNLWESLKSTGLVNLELFHFDDYYYKHKISGDVALIEKIDKFQPNIICLSIYRKPGFDHNVLRWKTLEIIKNHFKIPIMAIWSDLEITEQVNIYKALLPYINVNAATASSAAIKRFGNSGKCMYVWVPKDPNIFNDPRKKRAIDVSYAGTYKRDRLEHINYLIDNGVPVYYRGGERGEHLTTAKYADVFQRSKITLSFARAHCSHVINARPFEAMNCGAMVMEEENFETAKLFIPFVDYVPYTSKKDLVEKVKYYLKHDKERKIIARNGYEKVTNLFSAKRFWQLLIGRALKTSTGNTNNLLFLKPSNLSHLTRWKNFKLRFLNTLCSNRFGFKLFKIYMVMFKKADWEDEVRISISPIYLYFQRKLSPKKFENILKVLRFILHIKKK
jgi:spore maturation protein CgeB